MSPAGRHDRALTPATEVRHGPRGELAFPVGPKKKATQGGPPKHRLNMRSPAMRAIRPLSIKRIARHTVSTGQIPLVGRPSSSPPRHRPRGYGRATSTRARGVALGQSIRPRAVSRRSWDRVVVRQVNLTVQNVAPHRPSPPAVCHSRDRKKMGHRSGPTTSQLACLSVRERQLLV